MPSLKTMLFGEGNRIGRRLIVQIIAFSSLITLCLSAVQLLVEYRSLRGALDQQLDGVRIYVPNIAGSVWDFDEKQIRRALDALVLLPNMAKAEIVAADTPKQWNAGTKPAANIVTRSYSLRHEAGGADTEIGTLTVVAGLDGIYRQVATSAVSIVLGNGLKTFLVALFMIYLIRRTITGRLETMARKVHELIPRMPSLQGAVEPQRKPIPAALDELDAVAWTLDHTARDLEMSVTALGALNADLLASRAQLQASLRQKDVLLKEVHHRVKNNLQVVASLLSMQGRAAGAESRELLQESVDRVKAMALVHEQLYCSEDFSSIPLGEYLARLAENLAQSHRPVSQRVPIRCEAARVAVGIEKAIPLGLIVNELVSNAFKHGYADGAGGEIQILLKRAEDGSLQLTVVDDGRGLPAGFLATDTSSLGMQLVVRLTDQLGGDLRCTSVPGARFEIRFAPDENAEFRLAA
jgi:two-component sensor histidine kinase